jgi:hypothetical protein
MDHDDIAFPTRFEKEYDFLESHPDIAIVGTWSNIMDSNGTLFVFIKTLFESNVINTNLCLEIVSLIRRS